VKRPAWLVTIALVACLVTSACISFKRPGEYDSAVEAKLAELKANGQSASLRDLTDFTWDEVHLFNSHAGRDYVERVVGDPVIDGRSVPDHKSLLVFENGGEVVDTVTISGDYLRADEPTWGPDVVVAPWGTGFLRLTRPS
jgi:hypothetical protein